MTSLRLTADEARSLVASPDLHRLVGPVGGVAIVVVSDDGSDLSEVAAALTALPVIAASQSTSGSNHPWDLQCDDTDTIVEAVEANPIAAVTLTQVLRLTARLDTTHGLTAESLGYSTLQAGPEHARWLAEQRRRARPDDQSPRVRLDDKIDRIDIVMTRPKLKNQIDAAMRDQLVNAFKTAANDDRSVRFLAEGSCFSAGGDLAEFGTGRDPATSNLVRATANVAPWVNAVAPRLTSVIDGPCIGAGLELAAFAHRIMATPAASFRLPELSLGLIPGAGGTVSIPRRIGAARTLEWVLRGTAIDSQTALRWGLIDELIDQA